MIQIIGLACFAYIVYKQFLPMLHAERDLRLDWFGQWKHPRYQLAGTLHLLIFAGFLILATWAVYLLIFGLSADFTAPAALGRIYNMVADYAATIVSLAVAFAAVRRIVFKPARYAVPEHYGRGHSVDAIFLLGLTALLMFSESLFEATRATIQVQHGAEVEYFCQPGQDIRQRSLCKGSNFPQH